jgi:Cys-tRNA(Pro)/Cys-tRNA(Cys) deacylase
MATAKTNAVRLLGRLGIRYELRSYDVDPDDLAPDLMETGRSLGRTPR